MCCPICFRCNYNPLAVFQSFHYDEVLSIYLFIVKLHLLKLDESHEFTQAVNCDVSVICGDFYRGSI